MTITYYVGNTTTSGNTVSFISWEEWCNGTTPTHQLNEDEYLDKYVRPSRIVFSGDHTHVFWSDGTKISVKRMEGDTPDRKHAVASAVAIKIFGSRSKFNKFVDSGHVQPTKEEKRADKEAEKAVKDAEENFEWPF